MSFWSGSGAAGIAGGSDLISGFVNSFYNAAAQKRATKDQKKLMYLSHELALNLSNTAHQREVQDLRAAGINPILTATGGSGASAPVVSAPSVNQAAGNPFSMKGLQSVLANSASFKQAKTAEKLAENQMENNTLVSRSQADKNRADAALAREQAKYVEDNASKVNLGPVSFSPSYYTKGLSDAANKAHPVYLNGVEYTSDSVPKKSYVPVKRSVRVGRDSVLHEVDDEFTYDLEKNKFVPKSSFEKNWLWDDKTKRYYRRSK